MVETSIKSQLKQAIQDVSAKSAEVSSGTFATDIAAAKASQAQSIINSKESIVQARQADLDNVKAKLESPPTKEVEGEKHGCGAAGSKTVVDQEALKDLQAQQKTTQAQLTQAKSDVADARQEAEAASTDALTKAGISSEQQGEMQSLMDRIATVQDSLGDNKPVDDKDVTKLIDDFKDISKDLTKADNQSGLLSKAFYDPVKKGLQKISDLMDKNAAAASNSTTTPADGTTSTTTTPSTSSTDTTTTPSTTDTNTTETDSTADADTEPVTAGAGAGV